MKNLWFKGFSLLLCSLILEPISAEETLQDLRFNLKPSFTYEDSLLNNLDAFQSDFYRQFRLRHAPEPLRLDDKVVKNYFFPTLYGNVTTSVAMFFCSYEAAKKLMPHPSMIPVSMGMGRSLVILSSYHYGKVYGIPPYNEIAMSIPVLVGRKQYLPGLPLLLSEMSGVGFYVFSMPVTSLENQIRGRKLWGLPKVVQAIELNPDGDEYVTVAREETGEKYLEFRVPIKGKPTRVKERGYLYSLLDKSIQKATTKTDATFSVTKFNRALLTKGIVPDRPYIQIEDTPSGRILKQLEIEPQPFQVRFGTDVSSTFDLPHATFKDSSFNCDFKIPIATLDDLMSCQQSDLDKLYQQSSSGPIPDGESEGKAIFFPGSIANELATRVASHVWQGKIFSLTDKILVNKIFGFRAIRARVFKGESWFDGKESTIIDYHNTSLLASPIRDEIRSIGPGLYLGRAYLRTSTRPIFGVNFALDFRNVNSTRRQ